MPFPDRWRKTRNWFVHLLHLDESAHRIALGAALGIFIGLTPTVGLQMLLVFLVMSVIAGNRAAGIPMVWITNPATIVPVYSFNYFVGRALVGRPDLADFNFEKSVTALLAKAPRWWDLVQGWWKIVMKVAAPLWAGSVAVGVAAAAAAYAIMYYLITIYRRHHRRHLIAASEAAGPVEPAADRPKGATASPRRLNPGLEAQKAGRAKCEQDATETLGAKRAAKSDLRSEIPDPGRR